MSLISKGKREYKEGFSDIGELAKAYRLSEQRQGIARTRPISHDVDFYILSKDPIEEYEKFANVKDRHFREDLFPPRIMRKDNKYQEVKVASSELLNNGHDFVYAQTVQEKTGISPRIVRKHLMNMVEQNVLVRNGSKYFLNS